MVEFSRHHGGVFTAPWWSGTGTVVFSLTSPWWSFFFTMVFFQKKGGVPNHRGGRILDFSWRRFDFGLVAFRPDDEVLSKCCKDCPTFAEEFFDFGASSERKEKVFLFLSVARDFSKFAARVLLNKPKFPFCPMGLQSD